MTQFWAAESVCAGHPDKICDQVSDAIVDAALRLDPKARVAVETLVTADQLVLAGEVTAPGELDFEQIARNTVRDLGYTDPRGGFTWESPVLLRVHSQSPDISQGVDDGGAGDQGIMFGYASNETPELMPLPITLAHRLAEKLDQVKEKELTYLRPDGKTEVLVRYEDGKPVAVEKVVIAVPHDQAVDPKVVKKDLIKHVITPVLKAYGYQVPKASEVIINGTGKWEWGGPAADTGVTGRKIVIDSYGNAARVGGGAFSGKDPTKVDRSAAYAARYLAKNIVAAGLADQCEVHLSYVIGRRDPLAVQIETFGTAKKPETEIQAFAKELLDLSVNGILSGLDLRRPIYRDAARYGHFGRSGFPWEAVVG
jgi:S-adenosylmethionine synthetase